MSCHPGIDQHSTVQKWVQVPGRAPKQLFNNNRIVVSRTNSIQNIKCRRLYYFGKTTCLFWVNIAQSLLSHSWQEFSSIHCGAWIDNKRLNALHLGPPQHNKIFTPFSADNSQFQLFLCGAFKFCKVMKYWRRNMLIFKHKVTLLWIKGNGRDTPLDPIPFNFL